VKIISVFYSKYSFVGYKIHSKISMITLRRLKKKIGSAVYNYRTSYVRFITSKYIVGKEKLDINSPVFLLGTQGGGLTFTARMLWRNEKSISIAGDNSIWNVSAEMHYDLYPLIPKELKIKGTNEAENMKRDGFGYSWAYASDRYIDDFRFGPKNVTEKKSKELLSTIKSILKLNTHNPREKIFIDKSQTFTIKVEFLDRLFGDIDPHFVLITRNPYALCYRAAKKVFPKNVASFEEKLKVACQHWSNSMSYAIKDGRNVKSFEVYKFEDILNNTEKETKRMCKQVGLSFDKKMLPSKDDRWPIIGAKDNKWHPIRRDVNRKYLSEMSIKTKKYIKKTCGDIAKEMGYSI
jgi:ribosomal protein L20